MRSLLLLCLWPSLLGAQALPFVVTGRSVDALQLQPQQSGITAWSGRQQLRVPGFELPGGRRVELRLRRQALPLRAGALHVDGQPDPRGVDPALSLWRGRIQGWADSEVFLCLAPQGCRGWLGRPGSWYHLLCERGPQADWRQSRNHLVSQAFLDRVGYRPQLGCQQLAPRLGRKQRGVAAQQLLVPLIEAPVAFETDYEYFQVFNNLGAAQAYTMALLGALAMRFREQLDLILTLPYLGFHTSSNDPWKAGQCYQRLLEFQRAWGSGKAPRAAALYHMLTGGSALGCGGLAYVNVICDQVNGFGISGNIAGNVKFPVVQGPLTWDFMVICHELGHNLGSPHTHDYKPPIDRCASGTCIKTGTNMSYCHICQGGMNNMTLRYHPTVIAKMKASIRASCLKPFEGVLREELGGSLAGSNGTPRQQVGYLRPAVEVGLSRAPRSQPGLCLIGLKRVDAPLLGGILVPSPDVLVGLATDTKGEAVLKLPVARSFPAGITAYLQTWIADPQGSGPVAASNASRVELIKP